MADLDLRDEQNLKNIIPKSADDIIGLTPFMQYRDMQPVVSFFNLVKEMIFDNAKDRIGLLNQLKHSYKGQNDYLQFYYENLFNFRRAFGEAKANNLYDTAKEYDKGYKYDDRTFSGYLDLNQYKTLIKYFFDYSYECYSLGWIYGLVCDFCSFEPKEVSIECQNAYIVITCRRSTESILLQRIFLNKDDYLCVPIVDIIFKLTN